MKASSERQTDSKTHSEFFSASMSTSMNQLSILHPHPNLSKHNSDTEEESEANHPVIICKPKTKRVDVESSTSEVEHKHKMMRLTKKLDDKVKVEVNTEQVEVMKNGKSQKQLKVTTTIKKLSKKLKDKITKSAVGSSGIIKDFVDIPTSTRTAVVVTNCSIDLDAFFAYIPITDFEPLVKKRGRRPKFGLDKPAQALPLGSVVKASYELKVRGCRNLKESSSSNKTNGSCLSSGADHQASVETLNNGDEQLTSELPDPTGKQAKKKSFFLHCVVIDIAIVPPNDSGEFPFKNVKVYKNGKMHITGCKNDSQYDQTVTAIFRHLKQMEAWTGQTIVTCNDPTYQVVFNTVMENRDFFLGFSIFRNELDSFFNRRTEYKSVFEGSVNTGVNIKVPKQDLPTKLYKLECDKDGEIIEKGFVDWEDYQHMFPRKKKNEREHTFLVFATGHVIFSSSGPEMDQMYYKMLNILLKNKHYYEEKQVKPTQ